MAKGMTTMQSIFSLPGTCQTFSKIFPFFYEYLCHPLYHSSTVDMLVVLSGNLSHLHLGSIWRYSKGHIVTQSHPSVSAQMHFLFRQAFGQSIDKDFSQFFSFTSCFLFPSEQSFQAMIVLLIRLLINYLNVIFYVRLSLKILSKIVCAHMHICMHTHTPCHFPFFIFLLNIYYF